MNKQEVFQLFKDKPEALGYIDGDGHSLYDPKALIGAGYPASFIKEITFRHESDYTSAKTVIFDNNGNPVESMLAVTALTLHYAIAGCLELDGGIDYELYNGRGSQARELEKAIKSKLNFMESTNVQGV